MKQNILKIIMLLTMIISLNSAKAQYQSLFGNSQTSWNVLTGNLWGTATDSLVASSDTIINSINYKKILYYSLWGGTPQLENITGYLREDSTQGKAWYFTSLDTTEQLIMNLNLNLGDTFFVGGVWTSSAEYHPIDSIWIQSGRKYVMVDVLLNGSTNNEKLTFIEGIGTNIGLGYHDLNYLNISPYLLCSYKDNNIAFQNSHPLFIGNCNYTTVGIDDKDYDYHFSIYPNPSNGIFTLVLKEATNELFQIEVYNMLGVKIVAQQLTNTNINLSSYNNGIYLVRVLNNNGVAVYTSRIILQK